CLDAPSDSAAAKKGVEAASPCSCGGVWLFCCDPPQPAKNAAVPMQSTMRAKFPMSDASRKQNGRAADKVRRGRQLSQRSKRLTPRQARAGLPNAAGAAP